MRTVIGPGILGFTTGMAGYLSNWPLWGVCVVSVGLVVGVKIISDARAGR